MSPDEDHVSDSVVRTKSINLAFDPEEGEKLVYVGEQLNDGELVISRNFSSYIKIVLHGDTKNSKESPQRW